MLITTNVGLFSLLHTSFMNTTPAVVVPPVTGDKVVLSPPPRHWHTWQYCVLMFNPQQSPRSKPHWTLFVTSSQYPSPTHAGFEQPEIDCSRLILEKDIQNTRLILRNPDNAMTWMSCCKPWLGSLCLFPTYRPNI